MSDSPPVAPASASIESEVRRRYAAGADAVEPALCCPTDGYDAKYLDVLPAEIIAKDYGCGDPSRFARPGDVVVDLGSGAGKVCYILAQRVGPEGRVIGVDFNDPMLALARRHQSGIAAKLGYDNVRFVKGRIQDLALDLDRAQRWLDEHPITTVKQLDEYETMCDRLRTEHPMIASDSVDLIVSSCVLNLVRTSQKQALFDEMRRALRSGGRAVISDIVSDRDPTPRIMNDPALWSGCIAGAFREDQFGSMFERAGFCCVETLARQDKPWRVIDGVEFRSVTVRAWKDRAKPDAAAPATSACCG